MSTIENTKLSETLTLQHFEKHGFWIYDETRGMNLAMRAKTRDAAFIEVIDYYQRRLLKVESDLRDLNQKVESFLKQFEREEEE